MNAFSRMITITGIAFLAAACNNSDKLAAGHEQDVHVNQEYDQSQKTIGSSHADGASITLRDPDLDAVFSQYQQLTQALIAGDANAAKLSALAIERGASEIKGAAAIATAAAKISGTADLRVQRLAFANLNEDFIALLKKSGLEKGKLYVAHCPMALDNQGASWVSHSTAIRNPYFGDSMLSCGSVTETL